MRIKTLFYILALCITTFSSCNNSEPEPEPLATFKFVADGTLVQWNGPGGGNSVCILCGPELVNHGTYITLSSSAPQNYGETLILRINATNLDLTTYSDTIYTTVDPAEAAHRLYIPSVQAASTEAGDFASITITSVKDDKFCSGNFKARLTATPYGPTAAKVGIEGEFQNVKKW